MAPNTIATPFSEKMIAVLSEVRISRLMSARDADRACILRRPSPAFQKRFRISAMAPAAIAYRPISRVTLKGQIRQKLASASEKACIGGLRQGGGQMRPVLPHSLERMA